MASKELGMIHTVNFDVGGVNSAASNTHFVTLDLAGALSQQLQKMVRQGNYFKVVGVDMSIDVGQVPAPGTAGTISGKLEYYVPTKGRCEAYRQAFKAMAEQMANSGIPMRTNELYDFRVGLDDAVTNNQIGNIATLNGTDALYLKNVGNPGSSVFDVYNESVRPIYTTGNQFAEGFDTLLQTGAGKTDFVLNEELIFRGNENLALTVKESIPFQLAYGADDTTATFQFRPDPALYIAVMCGMFDIFIDDAVSITGAAFDLTVAVHIAGWKSIMGNPDKKKSRRSRRKGKGRK